MSSPQASKKAGLLALMGEAWGFIFIPVLVGIPFLLVGVSEAYETVQMERRYVSTRGTVVDNVWRAFAHGGAAYVPVVDFETRDGQVVRFVDGIGSIPPDYQVGAEVTVLYDPDDVQNARVTSWKRLWLAPTLITCVGLLPILIVVAVVLVVARRAVFRRRPPSPF